MTLLRILRRELAVVSIAVIFIFELSEKYRTDVEREMAIEQRESYMLTVKVRDLAQSKTIVNEEQ